MQNLIFPVLPLPLFTKLSRRVIAAFHLNIAEYKNKKTDVKNTPVFVVIKLISITKLTVRFAFA